MTHEERTYHWRMTRKRYTHHAGYIYLPICILYIYIIFKCISAGASTSVANDPEDTHTHPSRTPSVPPRPAECVSGHNDHGEGGGGEEGQEGGVGGGMDSDSASSDLSRASALSAPASVHGIFFPPNLAHLFPPPAYSRAQTHTYMHTILGYENMKNDHLKRHIYENLKFTTFFISM